MGKRCLYCYQELHGEATGFHPACSRKIFGSAYPPDLPYSQDEMLKLGEQVIKSQQSVTGVQAKLSLGIQKIKEKDLPDRFTIIGLWGDYILKPPTELYPGLPEIEDLTMHLASLSGIKTVMHSLMQLKSGQLAYLSKREDRRKGEKLHMEDMCQLTERLTEHKYRGSYEQVAKVILRYSANPGLDVVNFYEQVVFSFLTGNNDMHLKNFSLLKRSKLDYSLCPAYDLVASALVLEDDDEELALNLNGKKKKLKRKDFETAMERAGIGEKAVQNVFNKFAGAIGSWHEFIDTSFLPDEFRHAYHELIEQRRSQIGIGPDAG